MPTESMSRADELRGMPHNRDTELRELIAKWRAQAASERREVAFSNDERSVMNVRCALLEDRADELEALITRTEAAQVGDGAVAWLIRDRKTKVVWVDENSHFTSESEAVICALDMNDEIDDADFEAFPVFTHPQDASAITRVEAVLTEFEGMTGSGYRYMAANIRAAIKGPKGNP